MTTAELRSYPALDGLRGILMLFIVIGHISTYFCSYDLSSSSPAPMAGILGIEYLSPVSFFVVLSGYTLTLVYSTTDTTSFPSLSYMWRFFMKRLIRLAPMYFVSLVLAIPMVLDVELVPRITSIVSTLTMTQSLTVSFGLAWNGPLWTVSALALCYLSFPFWLYRLRKLSCRGLWIFAASCYVFSIAIAQTILIFVPGLSLVLHTFGFLRMPQFVIGMCAALLWEHHPHKHPIVLAYISSTILFLNTAGCFFLVRATSPNWAAQDGWGMTAQWYLPPVQVLLIAAISSSAGSAGIIQYALTVKPVVLLGQWSYAVYCLHFPLLTLLALAVKGGQLPLYWNLGPFPFPMWSTPLLVLFVIFVSALFHYFVEEPLARLLRSCPSVK